MKTFDAIVIGSGAGGLAAAVALSRAGRPALVLEQHYLPGGWCHSFELGGYRFSPGVHYIGELGPGGRLARIYEGLGVSGDLELCELDPQGFDRVEVAGERIDIPRGKEAFAERLKSRFPGEAAGIDGYLDTAERLHREVSGLADIRGLADALMLPFRAPATMRWGLRTLDALLGAHVRDPRLKAILAAQCGDHGLPPSKAPAALHAAVAAHYFDGAYYPRGGGGAIPRAFVKSLRRAGGDIRVKAPVERILIEKHGRRRRAVGVRLRDGTEIRARTVISNADPGVTYGRLVPEEHRSWRMRLGLATTRWSVSALSLFLAVDMDLRAAGMTSANVWRYDHADIDAIYRLGTDAAALDLERVPAVFLTATTLKDPSKRQKGHHTLEAFTFVPYEPFRRWAASHHADRPDGYAELKRTLERRMLAAVGRIVPGIEEHVVFSSLGTPLTNEYFVAATAGNLYGTDKLRSQLGPLSYPVKSEIDDLWLCGASTLGHGVFGATVSGLVAAARALGVRVRDVLGDGKGAPPLRIYPSEQPALWPEALRRKMEPHAAAPAR
jgi:all-trans-retinol 13,14-reductase